MGAPPSAVLVGLVLAGAGHAVATTSSSSISVAGVYPDVGAHHNSGVGFWPAGLYPDLGASWGLTGGGFGALPTSGAFCELTFDPNATSGGDASNCPTLLAPAQASDDVVKCHSVLALDSASDPADPCPDATYVVRLITNITAGTYAPSVFGDPRFTFVNASAIAISSTEPTSVPLYDSALASMRSKVKITGVGFEYLNMDQVKCVTSWQGSEPPEADLLNFAATRLSSTLIECDVSRRDAAFKVKLSLAGMEEPTYDSATYSTNPIQLEVFNDPTLDAINPAFGPAAGSQVDPMDPSQMQGIPVTITGEGFCGAAADCAAAEGLVLCRFGGALSPQAASSISDTSITCYPPPGTDDGGRPVVVEVSLNGGYDWAGDPLAAAEDFMQLMNDPILARDRRSDSSLPYLEYTYAGMRPPTLKAAFFSMEGDRLYMQFDGQETNRAGMNGLDSCARVLSDATVSLLGGTSTQCEWEDDGMLVAKLTSLSTIMPGDRIVLRRGVLGPRMLGFDRQIKTCQPGDFDNDVFIATSEPAGTIHCTVSR